MEYTIPIVWESYKNYKVEANNLQEAVKLALKLFLSEPDEDYLDDSYNIIDENYPNETFDMQTILGDLYGRI